VLNRIKGELTPSEFSAMKKQKAKKKKAGKKSK